MNIIMEILIILFLSIVLGEVAERLGTERVVGQLISGLILGPVFLKVLIPSSQITVLEDIAIFFIVLLIGIEVTTDMFANELRRSAIFSLSSFAIPFLIILIVLFELFHYRLISAVTVSLSVAVPSISIISVLILQNNLLNQKDGQLVLLTVVLVDIFSFIFVSSIGEKPTYIILILAVVLLVLLLIFILDRIFLRRNVSIESILFRNAKRIDEIALTLIILFALALSALFSVINVSFILGAFFAGMLVRKEFLGDKTYKSITSSIRILNNTFFIPLFFCIAGAITSLPSTFGFLVVGSIVTMDVLVFIFGTYYLSLKYVDKGNFWKVIGIFGGRGAVGIVIASYSLGKGFIGNDMYSIIILVTVIISIISSSIIKVGTRRLSSRSAGV
jgi:Kef-type K+ transport system membrane component KefB